MKQNELAILAMLSHSEGTDRAADPYRVCYGFPAAWAHRIADLSEHPAVATPTHAIEWSGESLASLGPRYDGEVSTAAGRFQINRPSWLEGQRALGLPDFTAPSQCDWVLWKIKQLGASALLDAGEFLPVLDKLRGTWASLPGGASGQPQKTIEDLVFAYVQAGGSLA